MEKFVDLDILANFDGEGYLVAVSKEDLHTLVAFSKELTIRHWDGEKPVILEFYGDSAIRTRDDASEENNLAKLPRITEEDVQSILG